MEPPDRWESVGIAHETGATPTMDRAISQLPHTVIGSDPFEHFAKHPLPKRPGTVPTSVTRDATVVSPRTAAVAATTSPSKLPLTSIAPELLFGEADVTLGERLGGEGCYGHVYSAILKGVLVCIKVRVLYRMTSTFSCFLLFKVVQIGVRLVLACR